MSNMSDKRVSGMDSKEKDLTSWGIKSAVFNSGDPTRRRREAVIRSLYVYGGGITMLRGKEPAAHNSPAHLELRAGELDA